MFGDEFIPPPECPVFEPNEEEFADPLGYINKIRPIAENFGICKIRPPPHWQPPFAIDVDNFRFTPRVQRINELGIHTRLRLQFIDSINKFWTLQGVAFKLPHVGGKALDLYGLHDIVKNVGGYLEACNKKQWTNICTKLGLNRSFSGVIHKHYEKYLYPYDMMKSGASIEALESNEKRDNIIALYKNNSKRKKATMYKGSDLNFDLDILALASGGQQTMKPRKQRKPAEPLVGDVANNKELAKLQIFGAAGPNFVGLGVTAKKEVDPPKVAATCESSSSSNGNESTPVSIKQEPTSLTKLQETSSALATSSATDGEVKSSPTAKIPPPSNDNNNKNQTNLSVKKDSTNQETEKTKVQTRNRGKDQTPYSMIDSMDNCKVCAKDSDQLLLMCDGCDDNYHTYCLIPPLTARPTGDWRCPKCIAKELNKKTQAYGFEQARKEYTLHSFGEMADAFKSEYFSKPTHSVSTQEVEREFWRLVGSLEEDLTVEYGADIHVIKHGSGFPRTCDAIKRALTREEEEYARSGWNLNNLPVLEQSLLRSISGDISGMKVPWVYVGMCFSAFCWHIEDHWTYSINYMHWGEPKTWYGIPREDASKFEAVMEASAPELFSNHPDLLHHLVTTMNPTTLMRNGVRVVRTNQCAGEFMITFPRAYHAGFNQGYNFAEAVNFCPADWVPVGRLCIEHYRNLSKCCVFSHEEIVCKVALNPEHLDAQLAGTIYKEMLFMVEEEKRMRNGLEKQGIVRSEKEAFECVPDDERQCAHCCTTVFLSALSCKCSPDKLVCLHHTDQLCKSCEPANYTLRYRYDLAEFPSMLEKLKGRSEVFDAWMSKVEKVLDPKQPKVSPEHIKVLINEGERESFHETENLKKLKSLKSEAACCQRVAQKLLKTWNPKLSKPRTINSTSGSSLEFKEMLAFQDQLKNLPIKVELSEKVEEYISKLRTFVDSVAIALKREEPQYDEISELLRTAVEFEIDLPQLPNLRRALEQAKWLKEVRSKMGFSIFSDGRADIPRNVDKDNKLVTVEQLRKLVHEGKKVPSHLAVEHTMKELRKLVTKSEAWEEQCTEFLSNRLSTSLDEAKSLLGSSRDLPVDLPSQPELYRMVCDSQVWQNAAKKVMGQNFYPYVHELEKLCEEAEPLVFSMEYVGLFKERLEKARKWLEITVKTFARKHDNLELLQILTPRDESDFVKVGQQQQQRKTSSSEESITSQRTDRLNTDMGVRELTEIIDSYFEAEKTEIEAMRKVRQENDEKLTNHTKAKTKKDSPEKNGKTEDSSSNDTDAIVYCLCNKPSSGFMLQCELCHEWYHQNCVPLPKFCSGRNKGAQVTEFKFLCPLCQRSRRPKLAEVLKRLLELQNIPVRIREGEALQFLVERAVRWQDKARQMLNGTECKVLMDYVRSYSTTFKDDIRESSSVPVEQSSPTQTESNNTTTSDSNKLKKERTSVDDAIDAVVQSGGPKPSTPVIKQEQVDLPGSSSVYEAAETLAMFATGGRSLSSNNSYPSNNNSTAVGNSTSEAERNSSPDLECYEEFDSSTPTKNESISEMKNGNSEMTIKQEHVENEVENVEELEEENKSQVSLKEETKEKLEELMFEGDLIEISLAESQLIWKILLASACPGKNEVQQQQEEAFKSDKKQKQATIRADSAPTSPAGVLSSNGRRTSLNSSDKKKKTPEVKRKRRSKGSTDASTERKDKSEKKRRKREEKQALIVRAKAATSSSSNQDDDENAICSAKLENGTAACRQPVGDKVTWVQCDADCQEWFHCFCVNISPLEAAAASHYKCNACKLKGGDMDCYSGDDDMVIDESA